MAKPLSTPVRPKETIRDRLKRKMENDPTTLKDNESFRKRWGEEPSRYHYEFNKRGRQN